MEKMTDILARTGKATTRELAAILKIDTADTLKMLRELQDEGVVYRDGSHWCLPEEQGALPSEPESLPVQQEKLPVEPNILPGVAMSVREEVTTPAPLKVVWSAPEDVQTFPTLTWVRQRRRELRNESRWLDQIENIARQICRKKAAVAYFRERV